MIAKGLAIAGVLLGFLFFAVSLTALNPPGQTTFVYPDGLKETRTCSYLSVCESAFTR